MPTLKGLLESAQRGDKLVVTPEHARWLEMTESERRYSDEAIAEIVKVLRGEYKHPRENRYSASSMGMCQRRVIFGYQGAPENGVNLDSVDMMAMGTKHHIFWQLEGLTLGWMDAIEVWTHSPVNLVGGSADAVIYDDSIFELKTVRESVYNRIVTKEKEPKYEHLLQFGAYCLNSGRREGSIVYEDRSNGTYHEFRVRYTGELEERVLAYIEELNSYRRRDVLPPVLDDCELRRGYTYQECPYRTHCLAQPDVLPLRVQPRISPVPVELVNADTESALA